MGRNSVPARLLFGFLMRIFVALCNLYEHREEPMSAVLQPFLFKFSTDDEVKSLEFVPEDNFIPVSRLVSVLGMDWRGNRDRIRLMQSYKLIKFTGCSRLEAALDAEDFINWLVGVNRLRVKKPELVGYFQTYFPLAWKAYRDSVDNPVEVEDLFRGQASSHDEYAELMDKLEIHIDRPLNNVDKYIAFLARFKGMAPEFLAECRRNKEVVLCLELSEEAQEHLAMLSNQNSTGAYDAEIKPYKKDFFSFNNSIINLKDRLRAGWLPSYIFFLQHPQLWDEIPPERTELVKAEDGSFTSSLSRQAFNVVQSAGYQRLITKKQQEETTFRWKKFKEEVEKGNDPDIEQIKKPEWDYSGLAVYSERDNW